jgi:hypothetical protein
LRLLAINIAFLLVTTLAVAQTDKPKAAATDATDTAAVKKDKQRWIPTQLRLGTDAISIARNFYDNSFTGWEVNADVDFNRYYLTVDYGAWGRDYDGHGEIYDNDGRYFRVGVDVNFLKKDPEKNMFFIGLRYGRSSFSENLIVNSTDTLWGDYDKTYRNRSVKGGWLELTTGIKVKMIGNFWMGYTARYKFGLSTNETGELLPSDVPGFGRTDKPSTWGFNYQLFFRIPVRKAPPEALPPDKKK